MEHASLIVLFCLLTYTCAISIQESGRTLQISNISPSSTVKVGFCAQHGQTTFSIQADSIIAAECNHLTVKVFVDGSNSASDTLCTNSELNSYTSPSAHCFNLEIKGDNAVHGGHIVITAADDINFGGITSLVG